MKGPDSFRRKNRDEEPLGGSPKTKKEIAWVLKPGSAVVPNPEADTEAFAFHRERFKNVANERNKKLRSILRTEEWSENDVAREEALRDDANFEKRRSTEFKEWNKGLQVVVNHLRAKRDDPDGEGKEYKTLILMLPGGKRVTYCAGQLTALHLMGYIDSVDGLAAMSGSSFPAAYFAAGKENGRKGTSIPAGEASEKEFFDPYRLSQMLKIKHVGESARNGEKALDQDKVRAFPAKVVVAVTREGGEDVEWIDIKQATHNGQLDMVSALEATGNIPFFLGDGIEVNGVKRYDGGLGKVNLKKVLAEFPGTTDVLLLPNRPFVGLGDLGPTFFEKALTNILPKGGKLGMMRRFLQMSKEMRSVIEETEQITDVNIGLCFPPDCGLTSTTMGPVQIEAALYETARDTFLAFGEKVQDVKLWKPEGAR
jgi:hypothetical protein